MAKWEPDRFVDEVYDEWCSKCNNYTEHTMGACFPCMYARPAEIKKKKISKEQANSAEGETRVTDS